MLPCRILGGIMDTKERLIDFILRNHGQSKERLDEQLIIQFKEEEREQIEHVDVPLQKRNDFYWRLYALTERVFIEQSDISDDEQLASIVAQEWNKSEKVPHLTSEVCRLFIQRSDLKMSNKRKALESICRGDIESYMSFQSHSRFFTESLTRYVICQAKFINEFDLYELIDEITAWFFPEGQREMAKTAMRNLSFLPAKKVTGRLKAYQKYVGAERLVFQAGLTEILIEHKGQHKLSNRLESFISHLGLAEVTSDEHTSQLLVSTPVVASASLTIQEDSFGVLKGLLTQAQGMITSLEQQQLQHIEEVKALAEIRVEATRQKVSTISEQATLRIAEEEIERLKQALEQEKVKTQQVEEKARNQIIVALGGSRGKYLLSDLLEESQGIKPSNPNVTTNRLINLFTNLNLVMGLEEYSDGRELNEEFTINRNELSKTFEVNAPIQSQEDDITVKIIKYGWKLDNKVVVSPLVAEITIK